MATQLDPQLEELARRIGELVSERRYSGSELSAFSPSVVQARGFAVNLRATDGAKRILGNDPTREQVVIQNTSASDIEVGGADLVLGQGLVVGANAERALGDFPGEVYLVTAAAGPLNIRIRVESA